MGEGVYVRHMSRGVILSSLFFLLLGHGFAQSFDWFQGDQTRGKGKFIFGTFTRKSNGDIEGTGIMYTHANRPGTKNGLILLSGNDLTGKFNSTVWENNLPARYPNNLVLKIRTKKTYRASFKYGLDNFELGAIEK